MKKLLAVILTLCLAVGLCGTAYARATLHPLIFADQSVSFEVSADDPVMHYSFTPEAEGLYVLYDVDGGADSRLSVHTVAPEDPDYTSQCLTAGLGSISFQAQAGVTYWLTIVCVPPAEGVATRSFLLSAATPVEQLRLEGITLTAGNIGQAGSATLICLPYGSADAITWTSSDETVVSVTGDGNGVQYQLLGAGTATITATTAGSVSANFDVSVTDPNALEVGQSRTVTIPGTGGLYSESEQTFTFTPAVSGPYALAVSFDKSVDMWCGVQMSTTVDGVYLYSSDVLRFEAEAGKTYTIDVEFWGNYAQSVDHIFLLDASGPAQGITLIPETTAGYVGDSLYVNVIWNPQTSQIEPLIWISSDPQIADISYTSESYAVLELYAPGNVTITATTTSGLIHSTQIGVYEAPAVLELTAGVAADVMLLGYGNQQISFTPAQTGYYRLSVNSGDLDAYFYESGTYVSGEYLYYLTGGLTYGGGVDCYLADIVTGQLLVEQVEVLSPAGMTVTKGPDTTVYLKEDLEDLWTYEVLAGLEMEVTWSDGSLSTWLFDEEGPYLGDEELQWQILVNEADSKAQLQLTCGDLTASWELTVLEKMIQSIRLLDDAPVRLVENSCGMEMADGSWLYDNYSYYHRQVELTFSDGSVVLAQPDEQVYGIYVTCQDDQSEAPWVKGGDNRITYGYGMLSVDLMVLIEDSPVERLELLTPPRDTFLIGDSSFFTEVGDGSYYFTPADRKEFLAGLSLVIWNLDGTSRTVTDEDIQWLTVAGEEHPFVDGYPLGLFSDLLMGMEPVTGPCVKEGYLEYKGASVTYPVHLMDELPVDPPINPTDPTDPTTMPTEPTTVPTEPTTVPTEPTTVPTEPTTVPTEPSTESTTVPADPTTVPTTAPSTEDTEPVPPTEDAGAGVLSFFMLMTVLSLGILVFRKKEMN